MSTPTLATVLVGTCVLLGASGVVATAAEDPAAAPAAVKAPAADEAPPTVDSPPPVVYSVAVLRALDKVTARVTTLKAPVGTTVRFGTLEITTAVCDKRPPEEPPEAAAFLTIIEQRPEVPMADVFRGWMFASSPGLSAMQHPVYDLWMLDCLSSLPSADSTAADGKSP